MAEEVEAVVEEEKTEAEEVAEEEKPERPEHNNSSGHGRPGSSHQGPSRGRR